MTRFFANLTRTKAKPVQNTELEAKVAATLAHPDTYGPDGQTWMHLTEDNTLVVFRGADAYCVGRLDGLEAIVRRRFAGLWEQIDQSLITCDDMVANPRFGAAFPFCAPGSHDLIRFGRNLARTGPVAVHNDLPGFEGYAEREVRAAADAVRAFAEQAA